MITPRIRALGASVFLVASAALVSTSVLLPLLDAELYVHGAVIEAEHAEGACARAHDHAVCMAWAGNKLQVAVRMGVPPVDRGLHQLAATSPELAHARPELLAANSRAPPTS